MIARCFVAIATVLLLGCAAAVAGAEDPGPGAWVPADVRVLETLRSRGDLASQREHLRRVLEEVVRPSPADGRAAFLHWHDAAETFAADPAESAVVTRTRTTAFGQSDAARRAAGASSLPPLIVRTHYNEAAYRHLRRHQLYRRDALASLRAAGVAAAPVPAFPREAIVAKSAWWPVPRGGVAALPVWDGVGNRPQSAGNDYPGWPRRVAVCDRAGQPQPSRVDVELLGSLIADVRCEPIARFERIVLDDALAAAVSTDPAARGLAAMVLGRPLAAGDSLLLVALHVATGETADWVWGTFWWHDAAGGADAARDDSASSWRHYRMAVAFDAELPRAPDGGPLVAFNPWFEARFPDSGQGAGVSSNCVSCHRRATFPARDAFVVTRGRSAPPVAPDGSPSVETRSLWSIPLEAR